MTPPTENQALVQDMQFGEVHDEPLSPELYEYGLTLYKRVRKAYQDADEPLGPSDEAMLVWFTFDDGIVEHVSVPSNPE